MIILHEILASRLKRPELLQTCAHVVDSGLPVVDPASGAVLCRAPAVGAEAVRAAILVADRALLAWKKLGPAARSRLLHAYADLIAENVDDLAVIMTAEQGKPVPEAKGEVEHGLEYVRWYAEEARRVYGQEWRLDAGRRILVQKEALGVAAAITPWNFPCSTLLRKIAPALAAGCPVLVKPASQTPLSALALAALWQEAGGPAEVFQVLVGDAQEIGQVLTESPVVRGLSFTGSTEVGRLLMRASAATVKRLSLELGGHAPFIVFADADMDAALAGVLACKFRNSGQTCVSANRLLLQESIAEEFCARLIPAVSALKTGNGFDAGVDLGPLIDETAMAKVERHVADALSRGASLACGGGRLTVPGNADHFFAPTLLVQARPDMLVAREETFGPLLPVLTFRDEAEALRLANATIYGLAAYFYSRDVARVQRVAERLAFGMVGVNTGRMSAEATPFGGVKQSGFGREGGHFGIDEFLEIKTLHLGGLRH